MEFCHHRIIRTVLVKGGMGPPNEGKDYTWYISSIYCQLGDYIPSPRILWLGFPLHEPYPYSFYIGEDSSILGT